MNLSKSFYFITIFVDYVIKSCLPTNYYKIYTNRPLYQQQMYKKNECCISKHVKKKYHEFMTNWYNKNL